MRLDIVAFALIPAAALAGGAALAIWKTPSARLGSAIQHLAAGVLFAALSTELLPDLVHRRLPWVTLAGFSLGVLAMLAVKHFSERSGQRGVKTANSSNSLIITLGVDVMIDGLLIGMGFAVGQSQGLLLTFALALEVFFLGLTTSAAVTSTGGSRRKAATIVTIFCALMVAGAAIGAVILANASASWIDAVLAFGLAALLYLVTEELLVEAHEVPETPFQTSMFFLGFIVLFLIEMLLER
jgi:ZIP family zinc transporter